MYKKRYSKGGFKRRSFKRHGNKFKRAVKRIQRAVVANRVGRRR